MEIVDVRIERHTLVAVIARLVVRGIKRAV